MSATTYGTGLAAALLAAAVRCRDSSRRVSRRRRPTGRDVVPTPQVLVEKMLDLAEVTANDIVVDLGSGDGRTVIAAAKRGATARGIEYNAAMVELSKAQCRARGRWRQGHFRTRGYFRQRLFERRCGDLVSASRNI